MGAAGNPKPETVLKVLKTLGEDEALYNYMLDFHPEIAKIMNDNFSHNSEYTYINNQTRDFYTSEDYYLILNLASTTSGTTRDEVSYSLGAIGIERLNKLIESKLVIESTDGQLYGSNSNYKLSFADTKKRVALSMKYYRLDEAGSQNNWMSFQTESLNEQGLKALKKLQQQHFNERKDQIYNNPMYKGNIKHYSASISSTFLPYLENGGLQ